MFPTFSPLVLLRAITLAGLLAAPLTGVAAQGGPFDRVAEMRRESAAGNHAKALALADSMVAVVPNHPNAVFTRAALLGAAGRDAEAATEVRKLLRWDPRFARFALRDSSLARAGALITGVDVAALAARADEPVSLGTVWATLEERDLILEGTAYDPRTRSFLVGSLHKRAILAVAPDGKVSDRVKRGDHGLGSVVGIHVDTARNVLWAASVRRFDDPADTVSAALFAFDAATGAFRRRIDAPDANAFLNDLTTGRDGSVYVTDSRGGGVYQLKPGATALERLTTTGRTYAPNGITISDDGRHLFVSDMDRIVVVALETGRSWPLALPDSIAVTGIDGLAFTGGALIAHHPLTFWRIARYQMDPGFTRITGVGFIERNSPDSRTSTTGEVVGDQYYYIGNGQIDRMNQRTIDAATMQPIRLYRAPLRTARDAPPAARTSLAPSPSAGLVAVALSARDSVAVLDALTLERVATLKVGRTPHELAAGHDGRTVYVADAGDSSITVIDLAGTPRVRATWRLPANNQVHDVAVARDGTVWAASGSPARVLELDPSTGQVRRTHEIARDGAWMLDADGPRGALVVTSLEGGAVTLLDPASGRAQQLIGTEGEIDAVATADGRAVWSVNARNGDVTVFEAESGRVLFRERTAPSASRVVLVPGTGTALVVNGGDSTVVSYDVATRTRQRTTKLASSPKVIALSRDGRHAYITHPGGAVSLLDVRAMSVTRRVALAGTPDGVAVIAAR